jgi:hypothetical protein
MEGLNEHSMQNAIQQLPQHRAGDHVWEEIRWQLDKPLSAELPLHTAPENAWQGIQASLAGSRSLKVAGMAAFALLLMIISGIVLYPFILNETNLNTDNVKQERLVTSPETATNQAMQPENRIASKEPAMLDNAAMVNYGNPIENIEISGKQEVEPETPNQPEQFKIPIIQPELFFSMQSKSQQNIQLTLQNQYETIRRKNERKSAECSTFHEVNTSVLMAADYEPEFFEIDGLNSPAQSFSISSGYRHNRLSFTLGAGYTRINGSSQIIYTYKANELVYSYNYVDSVYVDPVTHQTYYFTVKVDIYDSIDRSSAEKVSDRYSYMQFPLSLNYELGGFKGFTVHLNLSGSYHLLQDNDRSYKPFSESSSRLISSTMEEEKAGSDYWSAGVGLMLAWEPGNRLGLNLTPRIKYNTLPVKGSSEKGFVSYGINFGIYYKIIADR